MPFCKSSKIKYVILTLLLFIFTFVPSTNVYAINEICAAHGLEHQLHSWENEGGATPPLTNDLAGLRAARALPSHEQVATAVAESRILNDNVRSLILRLLDPRQRPEGFPLSTEELHRIVDPISRANPEDYVGSIGKYPSLEALNEALLAQLSPIPGRQAKGTPQTYRPLRAMQDNLSQMLPGIQPRPAPAFHSVSPVVGLVSREGREIDVPGGLGTGGKRIRVSVEQTSARRSRPADAAGHFPAPDAPHLTNDTFHSSELSAEAIARQIQRQNSNTSGSRFQFGSHGVRDEAQMVALIQEALPQVIQYDQNGRAEMTVTLATLDDRPVNVGTMGVISEADLARLAPNARIRAEARCVGENCRRVTRGGLIGTEQTLTDPNTGNVGVRFAPDDWTAFVPQQVFDTRLRTNRVTIIVDRPRASAGETHPIIRMIAPGDNAPPRPVADHWRRPDGTSVLNIDSTLPSAFERQYWVPGQVDSAHPGGRVLMVRAVSAEAFHSTTGELPRTNLPTVAPVTVAATPSDTPLVSQNEFTGPPETSTNNQLWLGNGEHFWDAPHPAHQSIAGTNGFHDVYQQMTTLESRSAESIHNFSRREPPPTIREIMNHAERVRIELGQSLFALAQSTTAERPRNIRERQVRRILMDAGHDMALSRSHWTSLRAEGRALLDLPFDPQNQSHRMTVDTLLIGGIRGFMGEPRAGLLVPNLITTPGVKGSRLWQGLGSSEFGQSRNIRSFPSSEAYLARLTEVLSSLPPEEIARLRELHLGDNISQMARRLLDSEIDVLFTAPSGRIALGEVKNFTDTARVNPPGTDADNPFKKVSLQIEKYRLIARALGIQNPEMHAFLGGGVAQDALASFRARGIAVHGPHREYSGHVPEANPVARAAATEAQPPVTAVTPAQAVSTTSVHHEVTHAPSAAVPVSHSQSGVNWESQSAPDIEQMAHRLTGASGVNVTDHPQQHHGASPWSLRDYLFREYFPDYSSQGYVYNPARDRARSWMQTRSAEAQALTEAYRSATNAELSPQARVAAWREIYTALERDSNVNSRDSTNGNMNEFVRGQILHEVAAIRNARPETAVAHPQSGVDWDAQNSHDIERTARSLAESSRVNVTDHPQQQNRVSPWSLRDYLFREYFPDYSSRGYVYNPTRDRARSWMQTRTVEARALSEAYGRATNAELSPPARVAAWRELYSALERDSNANSRDATNGNINEFVRAQILREVAAIRAAHPEAAAAAHAPTPTLLPERAIGGNRVVLRPSVTNHAAQPVHVEVSQTNTRGPEFSSAADSARVNGQNPNYLPHVFQQNIHGPNSPAGGSRFTIDEPEIRQLVEGALTAQDVRFHRHTAHGRTEEIAEVRIRVTTPDGTPDGTPRNVGYTGVLPRPEVLARFPGAEVRRGQRTPGGVDLEHASASDLTALGIVREGNHFMGKNDAGVMVRLPDGAIYPSTNPTRGPRFVADHWVASLPAEAWARGDLATNEMNVIVRRNPDGTQEVLSIFPGPNAPPQEAITVGRNPETGATTWSDSGVETPIIRGAFNGNNGLVFLVPATSVSPTPTVATATQPPASHSPAPSASATSHPAPNPAVTPTAAVTAHTPVHSASVTGATANRTIASLTQEVGGNAQVHMFADERGAPSYLGVALDHAPVQNLLNDIAAQTGLTLRNRGESHITILNPVEMGRLLKDVPEALRPELIRRLSVAAATVGAHRDFHILGLGHATQKAKQAYFLVVNSSAISNFRSQTVPEIMASFAAEHDLTLTRTSVEGAGDLHITVGFVGGDVHGVDKGPASIISSPHLRASTH